MRRETCAPSAGCSRRRSRRHDGKRCTTCSTTSFACPRKWTSSSLPAAIATFVEDGYTSMCPPRVHLPHSVMGPAGTHGRGRDQGPAHKRESSTRRHVRRTHVCVCVCVCVLTHGVYTYTPKYIVVDRLPVRGAFATILRVSNSHGVYTFTPFYF